MTPAQHKALELDLHAAYERVRKAADLALFTAAQLAELHLLYPDLVLTAAIKLATDASKICNEAASYIDNQIDNQRTP